MGKLLYKKGRRTGKRSQRNLREIRYFRK